MWVTVLWWPEEVFIFKENSLGHVLREPLLLWPLSVTVTCMNALIHTNIKNLVSQFSPLCRHEHWGLMSQRKSKSKLDCEPKPVRLWHPCWLSVWNHILGAGWAWPCLSSLRDIYYFSEWWLQTTFANDVSQNLVTKIINPAIARVRIWAWTYLTWEPGL